MKYDRNEYPEFNYPDRVRDYAPKKYKRSIFNHWMVKVGIAITIALAFGALAGSGF